MATGTPATNGTAAGVAPACGRGSKRRSASCLPKSDPPAVPMRRSPLQQSLHRLDLRIAQPIQLAAHHVQPEHAQLEPLREPLQHLRLLLVGAIVERRRDAVALSALLDVIEQ